MINIGITRSHQSSVTFLKDGDIIFHIENERLSRIKYDEFPFSALFKIKDFTDYIDNFCISGMAKLQKFESAIFTPLDFYSIFTLHLNKSFHEHGFRIYDLWPDHHKMHAACTFYNSGFKEAACIVSDSFGSQYWFNEVDGYNTLYGREATSVFSCKYPAKFEVVEKHVSFPFELKAFSTEKIKIDNTLSPAQAFDITARAFGFHALDGGKIMGMAPYGKRDSSLPPIYKNGKINKKLFSIKNNLLTETFLDLDYKSFNFQDKANFALALQKETQENMKKYIHNIIDKTKCKSICLAGGFFLNCVANYDYLDGLPEDVNLYIEPISGDAGTSIGAAKYIWHSKTGDTTIRKQNTLYYGLEPDYNIKGKLNKNESISKVNYKDVISLILKRNPVALYQGRSEGGPRALGNRSILYDPRDKNGKDVVNTIKKREWYRPFAGTVLYEKKDEWFDMRSLKESPYMLYAVKVREEKINDIPSITHIDGTCRVQTLKKNQNLHFYSLIKHFYEQTGVPILFNTSFNLAGDPLVETLDDALYTLRNSNLDYLFLPEIESMVYIPKGNK
jgi:carbamoyltransferase|tara:strand:- start:1224 stop:2906 length:1683 start_codon:yes stop_codon:yes gene_type:complete